METQDQLTYDQLNDVVHAAGDALEAVGKSLDSGQLSDLNDLLTTFLTADCDVELVDGEDTRDTTIEISFDIVSGRAKQEIKIIDDQYDEETIIAGLNDGSIVTTTWHGSGPAELEVTATGQTIGVILSQEIEGEYEDFE